MKTVGISGDTLRRVAGFNQISMDEVDAVLGDVQTQVGALNGQVPTDTRDIFSVSTYGADLTGGTNATTAVRNAMVAAWANVQATGRRSVVYFPAGKYSLTGKTTQRHIDINGMSKISFVGVPGGRSLIDLNGDSIGGDWYMFCVRGGSSEIEFRELTMDISALTNPDPAEQNHLIQIGTDASDIRILDCTFLRAPGDGIRLVGEFGAPTRRILIARNKFLDCVRAGVSLQRWCQKATIVHNSFRNGTDQQIDFEPTGVGASADAASTNTTVVDPQAAFITWGLAVGDPVYNATADLLSVIRSIDSQTQMTVADVGATWSSAFYDLPIHNSHHIIAHNRLYRGTNPCDTLLSLAYTYGTIIANNQIDGTVNGIDCVNVIISGNQLNSTRVNADIGIRAIEMYKGITNVIIDGNEITANSTAFASPRNAIHVADQAGRRPDSISITNNKIRCNTRGTGIFVQGCRNSRISGNQITLCTPGESNQSVAIYVRPSSANQAIDSAIITDNQVAAVAGGWLNGALLDADTAQIKSAVVSGVFSNCATPISFREVNGGSFASPPILCGAVVNGGGITLPSVTKWIATAGATGTSLATAALPTVFYGSGTPESVLTARIGSLALRSDGGAGTTMYVKESGTGATGWIGK